MLLKRSVSPLIATILIIVVVVILITIVLTWGKNFTGTSLNQTQNFGDLKASDITYFIYPQSINNGLVQFKYSPPTSMSTLEKIITHYQVINIPEMSSPIELSTPYNLQSGPNNLNLNCLYEYSLLSPDLEIQLITLDNTYISFKIKDSGMVCLPGGSGSENDPIVICSAEDLNNIRNDLSANYVLGKNIDLQCFSRQNENGWLPIGDSINKFSGSFNGNNYKISNLYIDSNTGNNLGLFGSTNNSIIENIGITDFNVIGSESSGALIGNNSGLVRNSYAKGILSGHSYVGCLIGWLENGEVLDSYADCELYAHHSGGGLIGDMRGGSVNNCYSLGSATVIGMDSIHGMVGGLVGIVRTNTSLTNSYSKSNVYSEKSGNARIGGLVGAIWMGGAISRSYSTGNVEGPGNYLGGLVGENYNGDVFNCYSTSNVIGDLSGDYNYVGGLIGLARSGTVYSSYFSGTVVGDNYVGGLVGYNNNVLVSESYFSGNLTGNNYVGGIVGEQNLGSVIQNYSLGNVIGNQNVGGLIGKNNSVDIINNYSHASIDANDYVGGLIGYNLGNLNYNYSATTITSVSNAGGLVGYNEGVVDNSYYDSTLSGFSDSDKGIPKTTFELKFKDTFIGWDFENIWMIDNGFSYPNFKSKLPPLNKNDDNYYEIWYLDDLSLVKNYLNNDYILMSDLNFLDSKSYKNNEINTNWISENGWEPIGNDLNPFVGVFNGNNHRISNLYINRPNENYVGLFGYSGVIGTEINDFNLIDVNIIGNNYTSGFVGYARATNLNNLYFSGNIKGNNYTAGIVGYLTYSNLLSSSSVGFVQGYDSVGGLVGRLYSGNIRDSYTNVSVVGHDYVGGFIGDKYPGNIRDSYSLGTVNGNYRVGGFAGRNASGVTNNCYATGNVTATSNYVGGFAGSNYSTLSNSYATGTVNGVGYVGGLVGMNDMGYGNGIIENCYADNDVYGTANFVGGLVGYNRFMLYKSYSKGIVKGVGYVGGIAGANTQGWEVRYGVIENCYSLSDVYRISGSSGFVAGGVGNFYDTGDQEDSYVPSVSNSYSIGAVYYETAADPTNKGFFGNSDGLEFGNYFDKDTSLQTSSAGTAIGLTTTNMKISDNFDNWDFTNIWAIDSGINDGYPYLRTNIPN